MFNKVLFELEKLKKVSISIPIQTDEEGYYDKECPSQKCLYQFKVFAEDWKDKFKDNSVYCPLCGNNAPADNFWTSEQLEIGKQQAIKHIEGRINRAFAEGARDFNRSQPKHGFMTMKMEFTGSTTGTFLLPIPSKKNFEQKIVCSKCGARYSVLGSAFFCPCCGYNSVSETFNNSIKLIEIKINNIDTIRKAVSAISQDEAELTVRSLIESGLGDGVMAFQRFCEKTYIETKKVDCKIKPNAFQNLILGGKYWQELLGESYQDWLEETEFKKLVILFQIRHLLAHSEGIVDERYIERTGDNNYKLGQRVVTKERDVLELVCLIKKLAEKIKCRINNIL